MLVLSRKLGEKIYIGENVCITVVDIDRGKIRLGIEAPRDVPIYRQEVVALGRSTSDSTPSNSIRVIVFFDCSQWQLTEKRGRERMPFG